MKAKLTPQQRVHRLIRRVGHEYGITDETRPELHFGKVPAPGNAHATTTITPGENAVINFGRGTTKDLRSRDPQTRRHARQVVLTELGRTIQGERGNGWLAHKTNSVSRPLNRQQARRVKRKRARNPRLIEAGTRLRYPRSG